MPRIIIDGRTIECRDGINVLQAALEAGINVPHYCYHPALSVVGSCRLCLMEMKILNPRTREMEWAPRLVPSCQTPVREGLEVRFESEPVRANQRHVMEDLLLNHPLDCPVCDQAGECWLQDYSLQFGHAESRMVEPKQKNPKKDIGPHTLLYQDRCIMCTRCVRFTREITGTHELCVVNRGSRTEIDVFPGRPLANRLQGNVVDICPVGSLLDKDFLFAQRVWMLRSAAGVCPGCATGCTTWVDHNDNRVWRIRPRHNPRVNGWWICDDGRYLYKALRQEGRLKAPRTGSGNGSRPPGWLELLAGIRAAFLRAAAAEEGRAVAVLLSPMMSCEEAWLLSAWVRGIAPQAALALGDAPVEGVDEHFPAGAGPAEALFTIRAEKCPNRRGVEMILQAGGGRVLSREAFWGEMAAGRFAAAWLTGGYLYPGAWKPEHIEAARRVDYLVVQDFLAGPMTELATVALPACPWVEREGTFVNAAGVCQPFSRAVNPPAGLWSDGQYLFALAGHQGLYRPQRVREMMVAEGVDPGPVYEPPPIPKHQH